MKVKNKIVFTGILILIIMGSFSIAVYNFFLDYFDDVVNDLNIVLDFDTQEIYKEKHRNLDIQEYDLDIQLFPKVKQIKADIKIKGIFTKKNQQIKLDFYDNLEIQSLRLNGEETKFERDDNELILIDENNLRDTFEVRVIYEGTPLSLGLGSFEFAEESEHSVIYTLNEPIFASTWFPCNDNPSDKAIMKMKITNDSSMISVSNGKLISVDIQEDRTTYYWESSYPISTYLVAIYSAPYRSFNQEYISAKNDTMKINYFVLPEKFDDSKLAFSEHPHYLKVLSELFGEYPFIKEKYGVAQIPWKYGAMESQTITAVGSNFISRAGFFSALLIHEAAHHWWGNSVTPKTWKDIWLNEGFATYSEALYWESTTGKDALISTMESFWVNPNSEKLFAPEKNIFSRMIYNKGAWVLHMLRREVGDSIFFSSLKKYFKKYQYGNSNTDDFKKVVETNSNKVLTNFFNQWVFEGEGKIEIEYNWVVESLEDNSKLLSISLIQKQQGYDRYEFPLDIQIQNSNGNELISSHYITSIDTTLKIIINGDVSAIELDPDNWLLAEFRFLDD